VGRSRGAIQHEVGRVIQIKRRDAWWTVFVIDPLAAPLVQALRDKRWITPNRISAASAVLAAVSAACFAAGQLVAGGLVFQLSFLLDCMDGKLARAQGRRDPLGPLADVASDAIRVAFCSTGLAIALARDGELVVDGVPLAAALVCLYVGTRVGVAAIAAARPTAGISSSTEERPLVVAPRTKALLRAAPRRASAPGTTVDTEAVAFTIGPLVGLPVLALAVSVTIDLTYAVVYYVRASRRVRGSTVHEPGSP
jgi:phosphatidylglycerophosphate synthase